MKTTILFLCSLLLSLFLSSCAVNYTMPDNRFETPEVAGATGRITLKGAFGKGKDVELTPDYSSTWVDTQNPILKGSDFLTAGGTIGLLEKFDVGLKYMTDVGLVLNGKFQMMGKRGEKGPQLATLLQVGGGGEEKSENSHTPSRVDMHNSFVGLDLILGYRTGRDFLVYSSVFHDQASYEVDQTRGSVARHYEGKSMNTGATLGISWNMGPNASLMVEFARAKAESDKSSLTTSSFGAGLNVLFL